MQTVNPVKITLDGVERTLRATSGAHRLIFDEYKMRIGDLLNSQAELAVTGILWALMHDADGNPPKDLSRKRLDFSMPLVPDVEVVNKITEAITQGAIPNAAGAQPTTTEGEKPTTETTTG
jgi:hypothetical protein